VHVFGGEAADNVIAGGVDSIEHGFYLTNDQLRRMKEGIFSPARISPRSTKKRADCRMPTKTTPRLSTGFIVPTSGVKIGFSTDIVTEYKDESRAEMTWDYLAGAPRVCPTPKFSS
jgi:imidazolonepropionase-like amidohydrolase